MSVEVPVLEDPRHQVLLEWELTAPASRDPKTKIALAASLGVSDRTLRDWSERPEFVAAWRAGFKAVAGSMERTKAVLDQLYSDATNPDNDKRVMAAKQWFDISKAISPPEPEVGPSRRAAEMSDTELLALLSDGALEELKARQ